MYNTSFTDSRDATFSGDLDLSRFRDVPLRRNDLLVCIICSQHIPKGALGALPLEEGCGGFGVSSVAGTPSGGGAANYARLVV